jgi:hypothetical protein
VEQLRNLSTLASKPCQELSLCNSVESLQCCMLISNLNDVIQANMNSHETVRRNALDRDIRVRMTEAELNLVDRIAQENSRKRSDVVRLLLRMGAEAYAETGLLDVKSSSRTKAKKQGTLRSPDTIRDYRKALRLLGRLVGERQNLYEANARPVVARKKIG